jgi:6-phosphogluconolactonase
LDVLYFSNEQGCSVSAYNLDTSAGTLSLFQTITTLPPEGFSERNTCSQIQITASGRFLYAPNRGHDSIACYTVDPATGELSSNGIVPSEPRPNALCLDLQDKFAYSAGQDSGQMAIFGVDGDTGQLTRLATHPLGEGPGWISVTELTG